VTYKNPPFKEPKHPVGTVAELFAGVGGFRVGLARAGWKTVYSNQWEPSTKVQHASDVYVANFGPEGHSNEDIATVTEIPTDFDLLVGGFPCQDYSVAKSAKSATGLEGKKGVLWWEILRLVVKQKPAFIFLENVDRLLKSPTSQRGRDFAVMLTTLGQAGYVIEWRVVNAAEYGFPQRRIRVFLVATRMSAMEPNADPEHQIFRDGVLPRSLRLKPNNSGVVEIPISLDPAKITREFGKERKVSPFLSAGFYMNGSAWTAKVTSDSRHKQVALGDVLVDDNEVPEAFRVAADRLTEWKFLKGAKAVDRIHKESGFVYKYSEGSMAFPDSLDRPSRTILTGEGGQTPSRFKHIVETEGGYRRLLPVELERLSGFPDGWTNPPSLGGVTDARRAFFIGNALVTGLIELVGKGIAERQARIRSR
jgi:DNA (cytosine-5)-methyltransferase 1